MGVAVWRVLVGIDKLGGTRNFAAHMLKVGREPGPTLDIYTLKRDATIRKHSVVRPDSPFSLYPKCRRMPL